MKKLSSILLTILSFQASAQLDTIYSNNDKIPCIISEVTPDAVKYKYKGEDVVNSIYKNTVEKIVFRSGRVQQFAEATSYKTVKGASDYENVTLTRVESEIHGLFKLGDVSAKAKGTTVYSSMEKVKERAIRKMKIQAAMMGGNIVYLTQNTTSGNQYGSKYQSGKTTETNMDGVAYSNILPNFEDFKTKIGDRYEFDIYEKDFLGGSDFDMSQQDVDKKLEILKVYNEKGLIMIRANIGKDLDVVYRVISFSSKRFIIVLKDGANIYNFKVSI